MADSDVRELEEACEEMLREINQLRDDNAALVAERDRLLTQLPEGMKHCTIVFNSCPKGHAWLSATNWTVSPCRMCKIDRLRAGLRWISESVFFKPQLVRWGADSILAGADLDDPAQAEAVRQGTWRAKE